MTIEIAGHIADVRRYREVNIEIPNNWDPRPYQQPLWDHLKGGGNRAIYCWHRRAGKDDVGLNWTARCAMQKPGTYWYMLPQASQSRKAVWDAVDPHTGVRRIDQAFPPPLRKVTRENEMFIRLCNGSTWQVVGSDNFNSLVGSPPIGCVFSEWALSNPSAWSYLRPILAENKGWALFNFTPRGRNHAVTMFEGARKDPAWFVQKLTAEQTDVFSSTVLAQERAEYIRELGEDDGDARYRQEYLCDFDAPLVGSFYAKLLAQIEEKGHICKVEYDRSRVVHTAWDLGRTDDTAIWFWQTAPREIHVIDHYATNGQDIPHFARVLQQKGYVYGKHWLPWDATPKTLASPRSIVQQLAEFVGNDRVRIVPNLDIEDGIQAARAVLPRAWFDAEKCARGIDSLRNYQREWDDVNKVFKRMALHNWASHDADAWRYLSLAYREEHDHGPEPFDPSQVRQPTLNEVWEKNRIPQGQRL